MPLSIGWMMSGIDSNPIAVGTHFAAGCLILEAWSPFATPQQRRLIVIPGTITEANICQRSVSPDAIKAPLVPPPSDSGT